MVTIQSFITVLNLAGVIVLAIVQSIYAENGLT